MKCNKLYPLKGEANTKLMTFTEEQLGLGSPRFLPRIKHVVSFPVSTQHTVTFFQPNLFLFATVYILFTSSGTKYRFIGTCYLLLCAFVHILFRRLVFPEYSLHSLMMTHSFIILFIYIYFYLQTFRIG